MGIQRRIYGLIILLVLAMPSFGGVIVPLGDGVTWYDGVDAVSYIQVAPTTYNTAFYAGGSLTLAMTNLAWILPTSEEVTWQIDGTSLKLSSGTGIDTLWGSSIDFLAPVITASTRFDITAGNPDYVIGQPSASVADLYIQPRSSSYSCYLNLYANPGDGGEHSAIRVYGVGSPSSMTNFECLWAGYDTDDGEYRVYSTHGGSGSVRPVNIFAGTSDVNQICVATTGKVGIGLDSPAEKLDVSGNLKVSGDLTDGTTARTTTEMSKGPPFYNVAASDAPTDIKERSDRLCDGTADDVQIQAALDDCNTAGGGIVFLSMGNFYIAASIDIRADCMLIGSGVYSTILHLAANCDMFVMDRTPTVPDGFFYLENMECKGTKATYSGSCFVSNNKLADAYFSKIFINNFTGDGFYTEEAWGWKLDRCLVEWCGGSAFYLGVAGTGPFLSGCKFRQNNKDGLRLSLASGTQAIGCEFKALSGKTGWDNSTTFYVQVDCAEANVADVTGWEVDDVVRNYDLGGGSPGDDWTGVLYEVAYLADATRLIITMDGAYDDTDVDIADGIDNTTKGEQAGLDGKEAHRYAGVRIEAGAHDNKIIGCIFDMVSGHNCIGVFVASSRNTIIGNKFTYGHTGVFVPGGLNPAGGSYMGQQGSIIGNTFVGQSAEAIDIDKVSRNTIYGNEGYVSQTMEELSVEGDGAATTIVVTHKLDDNKPSSSIRCFQITPTSAKMAAATYYISADTATTFTITFSAALENNETYSFYALAEFQRWDWDMTAALP